MKFMEFPSETRLYAIPSSCVSARTCCCHYVAFVTCARAFLANTAPEKVYEWLEKHEQEAIAEGAWLTAPYLDEMRGSDEREWAGLAYACLVSRGEPLVRLAAARFCPDPRIVRTLYATSDEAMHCAALSNRSLMAHSTGDYFLDDAALRELLNSGTQAELEALMTNPQLPASSMLPAIIHRRTFAEVLSEDRWYELISNLRKNLKLKDTVNQHPVGDTLGTILLSCGAISHLWGLLLEAPVTEKWGALLKAFLHELPYRRPNTLYTSAMDVIRGAKNWDLSTSIWPSESFDRQLRAEDAKFLDRTFSRWNKERKPEAPDEALDLNACLKIGLTKNDWELMTETWERSKEDRRIEADPYAQLRRAIANKGTTFALEDNLHLKSRGVARGSEKDWEVSDARLSLLKNHQDFAVRAGYREATDSAEINDLLALR